MTFHLERSGFHPGETAIHALLHIPRATNPTSAGLPANYARRIAASPLVAIGALDDEGRPWTTVWGGQAGFATPLAHGVLAVEGVVDARHDPVAETLFGVADSGRLRTEAYHISREELESGQGKVMAALSINLAARDRVKLAGRLVAGTVGSLDDREGVANVQMAMLVEESLGNCPKYLNKRTIRSHAPSPRLLDMRDGSPLLPREAVALLAKADLFFLSSTDGATMDTNHRGGGPGFVRVLCNNDGDGGTHIVYPEYSGNRLYQTLGNCESPLEASLTCLYLNHSPAHELRKLGRARGSMSQLRVSRHRD
jgi:predicted pyridoxine 5'-phosphate oxidase superfamily flavin-nucleotide-binding protein